MNNRISQYLFTQSASSLSTTTKLCQRPTLTLHADRPITVDMERFFDFSFSFAEALLDIEEAWLPNTPAISLQRDLALKEAMLSEESDFDIDARWM